jgi:hypothetical protein
MAVFVQVTPWLRHSSSTIIDGNREFLDVVEKGNIPASDGK